MSDVTQGSRLVMTSIDPCQSDAIGVESRQSHLGISQCEYDSNPVLCGIQRFNAGQATRVAVKCIQGDPLAEMREHITEQTLTGSCLQHPPRPDQIECISKRFDLRRMRQIVCSLEQIAFNCVVSPGKPGIEFLITQ